MGCSSIELSVGSVGSEFGKGCDFSLHPHTLTSWQKLRPALVCTDSVGRYSDESPNICPTEPVIG